MLPLRSIHSSMHVCTGIFSMVTGHRSMYYVVSHKTKLVAPSTIYSISIVPGGLLVTERIVRRKQI